MRRRDFITLLGGAAAGPVVARAQQRERMRRIGFLMNLAADDPVSQARNAAFLQALQELGWTAGRNLQIEYRWGGEIADRNREYGGVGGASTGRHRSGRKQSRFGSIAPGDAHNTDRVREHRRPGRPGLRR